MREIKFRAWNKQGKVMGLALEFGDLLRYTARHPWRVDQLPNMELMQFTGLVDKNGVEIYEGDLLKVGGVGMLMPVKWWSGSAGFGLAYLENNVCEVIGNIHANPELLERR